MSPSPSRRAVAIIGIGSVGEALARGLAATGRYDLLLGSRHADDPEDTLVDLAADLDARLQTPREAASGADVVVLAVPGHAVVELATELAPVLEGTPVLDCTNGPRPDSYDSIGEGVAAAVDAPVAKAFNTIGANRMASPTFDDGVASMFVCGDGPAVEVATELTEALGFDAVAAGDITAASHLEALAGAWIHLAGHYGREIGFRLLGVEQQRE